MERNPSYGHRSSDFGLSLWNMGWSWNKSASIPRSRRFLSSEQRNLPIVRWRIAHLTDRLEHRLTERFTLMANDVWLPEFIEIYIRNDLDIKLTRRDIS